MTFLLNRLLSPIQSVSCDVSVSVCSSGPSRKTHFLLDWTLVVEWCISNIGIPLIYVWGIIVSILAFKMFSGF